MAGIRSRTFNTTAGANTLSHFSLAGSRVIAVSRYGPGMVKVSPLATPTGREFNHVGPRLLFPSDQPFIAGEKVTVLYDT